jgi:hypothetical protein
MPQLPVRIKPTHKAAPLALSACAYLMLANVSTWAQFGAKSNQRFPATAD